MTNGAGNLTDRTGLHRGRKETMMPNDPVMLLSFINLKLRDFYDSLEALCADLDADRGELEEKLASIDYHYDQDRNQFV